MIPSTPPCFAFANEVASPPPPPYPHYLITSTHHPPLPLNMSHPKIKLTLSFNLFSPQPLPPLCMWKQSSPSPPPPYSHSPPTSPPAWMWHTQNWAHMLGFEPLAPSPLSSSQSWTATQTSATTSFTSPHPTPPLPPAPIYFHWQTWNQATVAWFQDFGQKSPNLLLLHFLTTSWAALAQYLFLLIYY